MKNFTYFRPASPEAAVALLEPNYGNAELLAGGTDLLDLQKEFIAQPTKVVSLGAVAHPDVAEIQYTEADPPTLYLGAMVKLSDLAASPLVNQHCAGLATAARECATPQIRNMGTVGGNLCQRNRCWYFRDEDTHCLLKDGNKCFALDGDNRYHAVFTRGQKCVCVNPSTLAPALIALGGTAVVQGPKGKRSIPLDKFFKAPDNNGQREHVLAANEVLLYVELNPKKGQKSASYEVRHKQSYDWPLVQAAVAFTLDGGKAKDVKLVLGHVAPTPLVSAGAAKAIEGKAITEETAAAAGAAATEGAQPLSQNAYKLKLIEVAVKRALLTAAGAKKYWEVA